MIISLTSHLLPSEDQSSGSPSEVRRELSPERVHLEGQRADTAPGPKWEQWLDQAHPHHCRNNDVSALCERNKIDVLSVLLSYLLTLIMVGLHCPVYSHQRYCGLISMKRVIYYCCNFFFSCNFFFIFYYINIVDVKIVVAVVGTDLSLGSILRQNMFNVYYLSVDSGEMRNLLFFGLIEEKMNLSFLINSVN